MQCDTPHSLHHLCPAASFLLVIVTQNCKGVKTLSRGCGGRGLRFGSGGMRSVLRTIAFGVAVTRTSGTFGAVSAAVALVFASEADKQWAVRLHVKIAIAIPA